jgi:hypothetical protein
MCHYAHENHCHSLFPTLPMSLTLHRWANTLPGLHTYDRYVHVITHTETIATYWSRFSLWALYYTGQPIHYPVSDWYVHVVAHTKTIATYCSRFPRCAFTQTNGIITHKKSNSKRWLTVWAFVDHYRTMCRWVCLKLVILNNKCHNGARFVLARLGTQCDKLR